MGAFDDAWDAAPVPGDSTPQTTGSPPTGFDAAWNAAPGPKGTKVEPTAEQLIGATTGPQAVGRMAVGGLAHMLPFNIGDEMIAGGTAATDALPWWLGGSGAPIGQAYDQRLNEVRNYEKAFSKENPISAGAVDIGGGLLLPIKAPTATSIFGKVAQGAGTGAALGAAYGFGGGESGLENRATNALQGGELGAGVGAAAPLVAAPLKALANKLSSTAGEIAPLTAQERAIQSLGVSRADISKSGKYQPWSSMDQSPLSQAIQGAQDRGVFNGDTSPTAMAAKNQSAIKNMGQQVNQLLGQADSTGNVAAPTISKAFDFIEQHSKDRPALEDQLRRRVGWLNQEGDGTLVTLNRLKQDLQTDAFTGTTDSKGLDQALAYDLRGSIESGVDLAGPGMKDAVSNLNAMTGEHIVLRPVIQKAVDAAEALAKNNPQTPVQQLPLQAIRSVLNSGPVRSAISAPLGAVGGLASVFSSVASRTPQMVLPGATQEDLPTPARIGTTTPIASKVLDRLTPLPGATQEDLPTPARIGTTTPIASKVLDRLTPLPGVPASDQAAMHVLRDIESSGGKHLVGAQTSQGRALGDFQFMPATAAQYGVKNPMDLSQSAPAADKMYHEALNALHDPVLALAAHERGAAGMARDVAASRARGPNGVDYQKLIAYERSQPGARAQETAGYIQKVLDGLARYQG